jgi:molecular chaperone GrpE (heat shock protein)
MKVFNFFRFNFFRFGKKIVNKVVFFLLLFCFSFGISYSYEVKVVYFYEEGNYFVFYYPNSLKLFVDINSGYVIKPEDQEVKINFVSYILNTKTFISRDEDTFTKLYLIKKAIGFNFDDIQPNNVDYYSWSNLTYKYLIIFLKNVENSITISIPSWENLNENDKRDIIEKYRLVFGTSFNEPRYLPYEVIFKKDIKYYQSKNLVNDSIYSTDTLYNTENTLYNTEKNLSTDIYNKSDNTSDNTTNLPTFNTFSNVKNNNLNRNSNNNLISFIYENKFIIIFIFLLFFLLITLFAGYFVVKKYLFASSKINKGIDLDNDSYKKDLNEVKDLDKVNEGGSNLDKILEKKIEEIIDQKLSNFEQKVMEKLNSYVSELNKKVDSIESSYLNLPINKGEKDSEFDLRANNNTIDQGFDNDLGKSKKLDPENLEIFMFKVDNIISKLKFLENYKDYNINDKATKIIFKLQELKSKIRASKSINMAFWEDIAKNDIIDLISLLDRYLASIDYNPNISKIRGELLNAFDLEEIEVIVGSTKVNIIEHKVEAYSRNPSVPNGIITDLKEKGYKYRGIVLKRAKVIENRV